MLFSKTADELDIRQQRRVAKLSQMHNKRYSLVLLILLIAFSAFLGWAYEFRIDQVARAQGEVIASSRVQVIKAVDGGVLATLNVREGDRVKKGDILGQLDQTRFLASAQEIEARLVALKARSIRLRAEVAGDSELEFPQALSGYTEILNVENALFQQRRQGLNDELKALRTGIALSQEELKLIKKLKKYGDVNRSEVIRVEHSVNEMEIKILTRRHDFLEQASSDLAKTEDAIAENEHVLAQRQQQLKDSVFVAMVPGIVKNIQVTTIGGVLRSGEELLQIIPIDDELIVEAKVSPVDIALVHKDLTAMIRLDPYDYTIWGGVEGKVVYVSADTLKERTANGDEVYYRVHIALPGGQVETTTGKQLDIMPGMTTQVDIKTGSRTVLEYLMKPLVKTLSESLGER